MFVVSRVLVVVGSVVALVTGAPTRASAQAVRAGVGTTLEATAFVQRAALPASHPPPQEDVHRPGSNLRRVRARWCAYCWAVGHGTVLVTEVGPDRSASGSRPLVSRLSSWTEPRVIIGAR